MLHFDIRSEKLDVIFFCTRYKNLNRYTHRLILRWVKHGMVIFLEMLSSIFYTRLSDECFLCLDFPLRPSAVSTVSLRADDALLETRHIRPAQLWGTVPSPEAPRQPVSCCRWDPCRSGFSSAQRWPISEFLSNVEDRNSIARVSRCQWE